MKLKLEWNTRENIKLSAEINEKGKKKKPKMGLNFYRNKEYDVGFVDAMVTR